MSKFKKDWDKYHLTVDNLSLSWSNVDDLAFYNMLQAGLFGKRNREFSKQTFFEEFPKFYQLMWKLNQSLGVNNFPNNTKILDIGSGVGVIDLLLLKQNPTLNIFLLDKEDLVLNPNVFYAEDYFFYNSWNPVIDCIENSNLNKDSITFLDTTDDWPQELDVITSYFSWCMHYPKEVYWDRVLKHLSPNGMLVIDIRNLKERNVVEEISDELKIKPKTYELKNSVPEWIDNYGTDVLGWRCVWKRSQP